MERSRQPPNQTRAMVEADEKRRPKPRRKSQTRSKDPHDGSGPSKDHGNVERRTHANLCGTESVDLLSSYVCEAKRCDDLEEEPEGRVCALITRPCTSPPSPSIALAKVGGLCDDPVDPSTLPLRLDRWKGGSEKTMRAEVNLRVVFLRSSLECRPHACPSTKCQDWGKSVTALGLFCRA